jgi:D-proline reductase (dithiol) PrdB
MVFNAARLKNQVLARVFTAFPSLAARWGAKLAQNQGTVPWSEPRVPLAQATVAVVTTGGLHLVSQVPFDMEDKNGDPSFREIAVDTPREQLQITHDYYDHRDAESDLNLIFPTERLGEFVGKGVLGRLHRFGYSVMGHIENEHMRTLQEVTAVEIARRLARDGVDYVLLVPA